MLFSCHPRCPVGSDLDSAFRIHSVLGPGLFEHVYEVIPAYELGKQHLQVARQVPIPIVYRPFA
jgi:GxxExxY protein